MHVLVVLKIVGALLWPVFGKGLMLLYRPVDISNECAQSQQLRYDLSYGMGMSDTITLVFRTLTEIDYECGVEITTDYTDERIELVVVIRYPNALIDNCSLNPNAFSVMENDICIPLCSSINSRDIYDPFFTFSSRRKVRFHFASNSTINSDMNAHLYEVTATSARRQDDEPAKPCNPSNETICTVGESNFCFTSGVVCDGINNCGIPDWFDERKSECESPVPNLGYSPVIAILAALFCAVLALSHLMMKCLPPLANSFFIFNANEDNRLRINPHYKVDDEDLDREAMISSSTGSSTSESTSAEQQPLELKEPTEQIVGPTASQVSTKRRRAEMCLINNQILLTTEKMWK